jgi:alpha-galactosidase
VLHLGGPGFDFGKGEIWAVHTGWSRNHIHYADDGWFGARRNDRAGLGDWTVSKEVWPDGLHPLVKTVTELGMQFGLWFEPEMINLDSDAARAHPEWVMAIATGCRSSRGTSR